jgi:hypothetical protein
MTAYEIKQYSRATKRYQFLAMVTAETPEEAKQKFIRETNYQPREGLTLFVKTPGCL